MGYHVNTTSSSLVITPAQQGEIFKVWCALNDKSNNHLKTGGSWSGGKQTEHWYSWMEADYDKTCKNFEEIASMLGFDFTKLADGSLTNPSYDSKTGAEQLFFERAAPFLGAGFIAWEGEDDSEFFWAFLDGKIHHPDSYNATIELVTLAKKAKEEKAALTEAIPEVSPGTTLKV